MYLKFLELAIKLREKGFNIREDILTIEEAKEEILKAVKGGNNVKRYNNRSTLSF